ncbi:hypothetical protein WJX84_005716 [Apatococcus fuscideae]|uniref:Pyrroline-5-carboxylate reductase n=1 Tax=Apatococcus fuscideae TaxID=2026836 RepID=A0AAW1SP19_9CHLO
MLLGSLCQQLRPAWHLQAPPSSDTCACPFREVATSGPLHWSNRQQPQSKCHKRQRRSPGSVASLPFTDPRNESLITQDLDHDDDEPTTSHQIARPEAGLPDRIGFLGAGKMGEALIRGFLASGVSIPSNLSASVRNAERQRSLSMLGIQIFGSATDGGAAEIAANSDIIIIGVKPQQAENVLSALAPYVRPDHLIISIAAGIRISSIESLLPEATRVVRVMPNTPCLIREAASAYVLGNSATPLDASRTFALMRSVGVAVTVEERLMDAVTGLSGSGPAYVFLMIEALADGAVSVGLPRDKALFLAAQTVVGAARMVLEGGGNGGIAHPALLKDHVASPAGTTIAGIAELEACGVRSAFMRAVKAAARRSEELT